MLTAKIFVNGRSQAVRLPKECQFEGDEVCVGDWRMTVKSMTGHRIDKVRLARIRE